MCSSIFYAERSIEASHNVEIAIASSVSTFVVASLLFFAIGFLCGCFCKRERKKAESASPAEQTQTPYYDDVVLQQHKQQELELQDNI